MYANVDLHLPWFSIPKKETLKNPVMSEISGALSTTQRGQMYAGASQWQKCARLNLEAAQAL